MMGTNLSAFTREPGRSTEDRSINGCYFGKVRAMDFPSKYELQVTVPEKGVLPSLACECPGASIGHCEKMLDYDEP